MTELEVFQKSLEVSRITLIITICLSLSSMVFAILEMAFQRSHNKKSVKPLCDLDIEEGEGRLCLSIRNLGLGPMIVRRITSGEPEHEDKSGKADGTKKEDEEAPSTSEDFRDCLPGRIAYAAILPFRDEYVLAPGGSLTMVEYAGGESKAVSRIKKALDGKVLTIAYEDIYEQRHRKVETIRFES
jgi:hypothetical protein